MGSATPRLWSLTPAESDQATLTIRLKCDIHNNKFSIACWADDEYRRSSRTRHIEVPDGGDLGDLGRVCNDLVNLWLWAPTFHAGVGLALAIDNWYHQE